MEGWIKIDRKIRSNWIWKDPVKLKWWFDILLEVNFESNKFQIGYQLFECKRGESLMSLQNWAKRWNVSKSVVNNFFKLLQQDGMIELKSETVTTRLTVCNYDAYQTVQNATETHRKRKRNAKETQESTIKELKENNNDKNTLDERKKVFYSKVAEYAGQYPKEMLRNFYDYWTESDGKKMMFETKTIFEVSKRLATWNRNNKNKSYNETGNKTSAEYLIK